MRDDLSGPMRVALVVDADVVPRHVAFLSEAIDDDPALCLAALIRVRRRARAEGVPGSGTRGSGSIGASRGPRRMRSDADRRGSAPPRRGCGRTTPASPSCTSTSSSTVAGSPRSHRPSTAPPGLGVGS